MKSNMLLLMVICFSFPLASFATEVLYVDTDAYGTPVVMTNALGNKVWEGQHLPFGERYQDTASPEENNIGFIGKERDVETELSYFDARYYDDTMGRFTTVDPIGPVDPWSSTTDYAYLAEPQRLSRYAYGLNNPYRFVDPDGRMSKDIENGINPFEMTENGGPGGYGGYTGGKFSFKGFFKKTKTNASREVASKGTPSLDSLSKAAGAADKGGFTKAGRSLQKHGSRPGSKWSQQDINVNSPKQANSRAQDLVDDVLTTPGGKVQSNPRGGWDAVAPDGRTVRYNRDGTMQGLRE